MDENVYIYIYVNLTCRKKRHFLIICEMPAKFTPEDVFFFFYVYIRVFIYIYVYMKSSISDCAKIKNSIIDKP